jgi:disulfide reductase
MSRSIAVSSCILAATLLPSASFPCGLHAENTVHSPILWTEDYAQALRQAKNENKPIFLFFTGSDWCPWCKRFEKEILQTPEFSNLLGKKVIFVKADFPQSIPQNPALQEQNEQLKTQYSIRGFPTIILLDQNGSEVARMGYEKGGGKAFAEKVQKKLHDYFAKEAKKS